MSYDEQNVLTAQVQRLENERNELSASVEKAREELRVAEARRDVRVMAIANRRRTRRILFVVGTVFFLVGGGAIAWIAKTYVNPETLRGHVAERYGPAPTEMGEACSILVEPAYVPYNGSLRIDCGGQRIYGYDSFGQIRCTTIDRVAVRCVDDEPMSQDGDPSVRFDKNTRRLVIEDQDHAAGWQTVIALDL